MSAYGLGIFDQHAQLLEASAIDPDVASERGYVSVDTQTRLEQAGFSKAQRRTPGLLIPIHGVDGQIVGHEYRPDRPRISDNGKTIKYEKPAGARNRLDIPPRIRALLADPTIPLWTTEGARKVDAAVTAGLCCIGIAGVYGWRGTDPQTGGKTALADWEDVALNDRDIVLAFDADVMTNPKVHEALTRFRTFLAGRRATVRILQLPDLGDGHTGLDDYLAAGHDRTDLEALIVDQLDTSTTSGTSSTPRPDPPATPCTLDEVLVTFRRWLHLPDADALLVVLAAAAANRMPGDPVWVLLVGPPGGGKTELLTPLCTLSDVHQAATFTEAALLSGTPKREAKDAKGGLLREIGDFGIIVAKDFGSVLSMHRDARAAVLAALREIYDGSWVRHVGTDGGRTLAWSGKVGLIAGCTPAIDQHHAVMGSMGERFALYRLPAIDGDHQARRALQHARNAKRMRAELAAAVAGLFATIRTDQEGRQLDDTEEQRLIDLATLAVRCRSAVERDSHTREVELIPEPEAPGRLALVLARLLEGLDIIGVPRDGGWRIVTKVALDSMSATRRRVLEHLIATGEPSGTGEIAQAIGYPTTTARRALEDLTAHGVLDRERRTGPQGDLWTLTEWAVRRWPSVPETSHKNSDRQSVQRTAARSESPIYLPLPMDDDKTGTLAEPRPRDLDDLGAWTSADDDLDHDTAVDLVHDYFPTANPEPHA
jgi:hypothetical protein